MEVTLWETVTISIIKMERRKASSTLLTMWFCHHRRSKKTPKALWAEEVICRRMDQLLTFPNLTYQSIQLCKTLQPHKTLLMHRPLVNNNKHCKIETNHCLGICIKFKKITTSKTVKDYQEHNNSVEEVALL